MALVHTFELCGECGKPNHPDQSRCFSCGADRSTRLEEIRKKAFARSCGGFAAISVAVCLVGFSLYSVSKPKRMATPAAAILTPGDDAYESPPKPSRGRTSVRGYLRSDGVYVSPYER